MADIRLIAVSLASSKPSYIKATATKEALHIGEIVPLPVSVTELKKRIEDLKAKAEKAGAEFVIEDPSGLFASVGRCIRLDDVDSQGRPAITKSMERYLALKSMNAISLPKEFSQLQIGESLYNIRHSDSGKVVYEINWESMQPNQRLLLLAVHVGTCSNIFAGGFLNALLHAFGASDKKGFDELPHKTNEYGGRTIKL